MKSKFVNERLLSIRVRGYILQARYLGMYNALHLNHFLDDDPPPCMAE